MSGNGVRSSKRRRLGDVATADHDIPKPVALVRQAKYCINFGFYSAFCCSGCQKWADLPSVLLSIDSRDEDLLKAMEKKLDKQVKTHKSPIYACSRPWLINPKSASVVNEDIILYQQDYIEWHISCRSTFVVAPAATMPATPRTNNDPISTEAMAITPMQLDAVAMPPPVPTTGKRKYPTERINNEYEKEFQSNGQQYCVTLPESHTVVLVSHKKRWENMEKKYNRLNKAFNRKRFPKKDF